MKSRSLVFPLLAAAALGCGGDGPERGADPVPALDDAAVNTPQPDGHGTARATLRDAQGREVGTAIINEEGTGIRIAITVTGMQPGERGFHVHAVGRCDPPDFQSAGPHFAPQGNQHGFDNPQGPHAGDMRNILVGQDGTARLELTNEAVTVGVGPNSIFDGDGTSLVIHAGPDDYRTDPSGNSGDRIACGVVERV